MRLQAILPIAAYAYAEEARKMRVKVHYVGIVRNLTNRGEDEFELKEGASLSELLNKLAGNYGEPFEKEIYASGMKDVKTNFVVTVNGALMGQLNGIDTHLNNGDNVVLMSLMTGG